MPNKAKFYVLLSHKLQEIQIDAVETMGLEIVDVPKSLLELWKQVDLPVSEHIKPIMDYLESVLTPQDSVLIQGHAGATYLTVNRVKSLGATALYAHSPRINLGDEVIASDTTLSKKKFVHKQFWEYGV